MFECFTRPLVWIFLTLSSTFASLAAAIAGSQPLDDHDSAYTNGRAKASVPRKTHRTSREVARSLESGDKHRVEIEGLHERLSGMEEASYRKDEELTALRRREQEREELLAQMARSAQEESHKNALLQDQLGTLTVVRRNEASLLESRTSELRAAQVYLSKADAFSDADVQERLETLSANIFQCAAQLADTFPYKSAKSAKPNAPRMRDRAALRKRVAQSIESGLTQALETAGDRLDTLLVQTAAQACMSRFFLEVITSWDLGATGTGQSAANIYAQLLQTEYQAVASRWRALTRKGLRIMSESGPGDVAPLKTRAVNQLGDIIVLCGIGGDGDPYKLISEKYGSRLQEAAEQALELRKVIGEDVVACDFKPVYVSDGDIFLPDSMDDAFGNGDHHAADEKVMCTVTMGLERIEKSERDGVQRTLLLKPGVALQGLPVELEEAREV
ncbi:hypothetical protein OBBRIDRAFT_888123 [Obba rivulosa]|uniref:Uncharacterized protein n=1 Tax=Obba rivulosa TaxID=1052685 RepID=A0A8E2DKB8_9APHY|nr:hypothetical protein OBBRIDRAFT_888123 [Obba rivulosa]